MVELFFSLSNIPLFLTVGTKRSPGDLRQLLSSSNIPIDSLLQPLHVLEIINKQARKKQDYISWLYLILQPDPARI